MAASDNTWLKQTPLTSAAAIGHLDIIQYLDGKPGIDLAASDGDGQTPLTPDASPYSRRDAMFSEDNH